MKAQTTPAVKSHSVSLPNFFNIILFCSTYGTLFFVLRLLCFIIVFRTHTEGLLLQSLSSCSLSKVIRFLFQTSSRSYFFAQHTPPPYSLCSPAAPAARGKEQLFVHNIKNSSSSALLSLLVQREGASFLHANPERI